MKTLKLTTLLAAVGLLACEQVDQISKQPALPPVTMNPNTPQPPVKPVAPMTEPTEVPAETPVPATFDPVDVEMEPGMGAELMPEETPPEPAVRSRRRMDLDQLDRALRTVTGGIGWDVDGANQLVALSATLGKPNYTTITAEDLQPTAMFQKFLGDAARAACFELMEREVAEPSQRVLLVHVDPDTTIASNPRAVEANLLHALLRFHGRSAESIGGEIEQWKWLYQSAEHIATEPVNAWRTVCVALLTHPDFYTY